MAGVLTRLKGAMRMVFSGVGGGYPQLGASYGSYLGNLLPGSRYDYAREAGLLWQNSIVSIVLGWLQRTFPEPRLQVCDEDAASGELTPVAGHPLLALLRRPNPYHTDWDLWKATLLSYVVDGNAYWMKARGGGGFGQPLQLWYIPHFMIAPYWEHDGSAYIEHYVYRVNGVDYPIDPRWIVHFRNGIDPLNTRRGLAPLAALLREVCGDNEGANMTAAIMRNVGVPGLLVSPADPKVEIPAKAADAMKAKLASEFTGDRRGEPLVLNNAVKVDMPGFSPRDMLADFLRKVPEERISAALGVPAGLAGLGAGLDRNTYCIISSMRLTTTEGPLPIGEVQPGMSVWSLDGDRMVARRVLWQGKTGKAPILRIVAQGRELRVTEKHPFLVRSRTKAAGQTGRVCYGLEYKPAGELMPGDVLVSAYQYPDSPSPTAPEPVDAETMEFLGAMLGDGYVTWARSAKGSLSGRVSMAGNPGPVREAYAQIARRIFTQRSEKPIHLRNSARCWVFSSSTAVRYLERMGVTGVAKTKRIPGWVFTQPRPLRLAFLRGLIDTDGSVDKKGRISYTSACEGLARDVRDLALSCGMQVSALRIFTQHARLPNGVRMDSLTHCFALTVASLNREIGSRSPEDLRRLEEGAATRYKGRRGATEGTRGAIAPPENCEFLRVTAIERLPAEDVYDIEVEGTHNFFAEHLCVHNSNYAEAREAYLESTLMPMQGDFAATLTRGLLPDFEDLMALEARRVCWDYSQVRVLQEDKDSLHARNRDDYTAGLISQEEAREATGRTRTPEGTGHTFKPEQDHARSLEMSERRQIGAKWRARLDAERKASDAG